MRNVPPGHRVTYNGPAVIAWLVLEQRNSQLMFINCSFIEPVKGKLQSFQSNQLH